MSMPFLFWSRPMIDTARANPVTAEAALKGRSHALPTAELHHVSGQPLKGPYRVGTEVADFGLGCFWGAERLFWKLDGVHVTMVGYQGGYTPNPTYEEVCTGKTGHTEVVRVVFDPARISYQTLLKAFFEAHDPTQGNRQGNDIGTQYRSAVYTHGEQQAAIAHAIAATYRAAQKDARGVELTTEIRPAPEFFFAEAYHQQYLSKNPGGYCGLKGTGVACTIL
jgi:peptide-methionine (S)-S-oxide reductase